MQQLAALFFSLALPTLTLAEVERISPADAAKLVADGRAVLVDVREPSEWKESGVAAPARLLPKSDFDGERAKWNEFLQSVGDRTIIVYCRTGRRSGLVGEGLAELNHRVLNAGGFAEWQAAGLPVRQPEESAR
jgi:rhodanese-related sulfurtransferase